MANEISNSEDIIDSRDVIARIEELEEERVDLVETKEEAREDYVESAKCGAAEEEKKTLQEAVVALADWDASAEAEELRALRALRDEAADYAPDWEYGETLIRDSYFKEYAQELAEDIGAVNSEASWPNDCIDWDEAARRLLQDYTEVDFGGVAYWIR